MECLAVDREQEFLLGSLEPSSHKSQKNLRHDFAQARWKLRSSFDDSTFQRIGPNIAQDIEGGIDGCVPLKFDAERGVPSDFAEFARRHIILSRSCENGGKVCGGDGNDTASAAFGEEGVFGGDGFVE